MKYILLGLGALVSSAVVCSAVTIFEGAGATPASITATRDAFRTAIGGGTVAGAGGDFGGIRREINWDGVPDTLADPNLLSGDFFNTTSPRGVVLSTPGSGLLVSANAGLATPALFGFPSDLQAFSPQKLFTAVNSNIVDVTFFLPGTTTVATTSAFGLVFADVEVADTTRLEFFDQSNNLIFSQYALLAGNQGLSFLGGVMGAGEELIGRVRITSGANTIVSTGVLGNPYDDFVAMDDFIYATPSISAVPEVGSCAVLLGLGLASIATMRRRLAALKT
jgi:hypothetical protein